MLNHSPVDHPGFQTFATLDTLLHPVDQGTPNGALSASREQNGLLLNNETYSKGPIVDPIEEIQPQQSVHSANSEAKNAVLEKNSPFALMELSAVDNTHLLDCQTNISSTGIEGIVLRTKG